MGTEFPSGVMGMFWNQIMVMVAQYCEYCSVLTVLNATELYAFTMGKMVTFMLRVFYPNFWTPRGSVRTPRAGHYWSAQKFRRSAQGLVWFPKPASARALRNNKHHCASQSPMTVSTHRTLLTPKVEGGDPTLTNSPTPAG